MKWKHLLITGALAYSSQLNAQFFAGLSGGYGIPAAQQVIGINNTPNDKSVVSGSFGAGTYGNLLLGFQMKTISIGLDVNYLSGATFESQSMTLLGTTTITTARGTYFGASPYVKLMKESKGLNPYSRFGLVIGTGNVRYQEEQIGMSALSGRSDYRDRGGFSWGFLGALGMELAILDKLDLFGEVYLRGISHAPDRRTWKEVLGGGTTPDDTNYSKDDPFVQGNTPQIYLPFSAAGFNLGFKYRFENDGEKKKKDKSKKSKSSNNDAPKKMDSVKPERNNNFPKE